jgi:hypothetical protein
MTEETVKNDDSGNLTNSDSTIQDGDKPTESLENKAIINNHVCSNKFMEPVKCGINSFDVWALGITVVIGVRNVHINIHQLFMRS